MNDVPALRDLTRELLDLTDAQRADLQTRSAPDLAEKLRSAVGMERKSHLEMRAALGGAAREVPIRKTAPLAEMPEGELVTELLRTRQDTLALLDEVGRRDGETGFTVWSAGDLVPPRAYASALLARLRRLDGLLRG